MEKSTNCSGMRAGNSIYGRKANPEKGATGWQIRCVRCDFTEPWSKAVGKKFLFGRCPNCKRIRFHIIEKVPLLPPD